MPKELWPDDSGRTAHNLTIVARLKRGVSLPTAVAEMNTIAKQLKQQYGSDDDAVGVAWFGCRTQLTARLAGRAAAAARRGRRSSC